MTVSLAEAQTVTVEVIDALGRLVATAHDGALEPGTHQLSMPVADLAAGAYVVRVNAAGETLSRRLTVVR